MNNANTNKAQKVTMHGETVVVICASGRDVLVSCKDGQIWVPLTHLWWEGDSFLVPQAEET